MMEADERETAARLVRACAALGTREQEVLRLLSIVSVPVSRTTLAGYCRALGGDFVGVTPATLGPPVRRLVEAGLVVEEASRLTCHPLIVEDATWQAVRSGRFEAMARAVESVAGPAIRYSWSRPSHAEALRDLRIALYRGDLEAIDRAFEAYGRAQGNRAGEADPIVRIVTRPFDPERLRAYPDAIVESALTRAVSEASRHLRPADEAYAALVAFCADPARTSSHVTRGVLLEERLLRGEVAEVEAALAREAPDDFPSLRAWVAFLRGDTAAAVAGFERSLADIKRATRKRKVFFTGASGVVFQLALLATRTPERLQQALANAALVAQCETLELGAAHELLGRLAEVLGGGVASTAGFEPRTRPGQPPDGALPELVRVLGLYWLDAKAARAHLDRIEAFAALAAAAGLRWLAAQVGDVVRRIDDSRPADELPPGTVRLADLVAREQPWERVLRALEEQLTAPAAPARPAASADARLVWWVSVHGGRLSLAPREQRRTARGEWTKGRPVALKRLYHEAVSLDFLDDDDRRVLRTLGFETVSTYYGRYAEEYYSFDSDRAALALAGHPRVFRADDPEQRVEVVRGEPALVVRRTARGLRLEITPAFPDPTSTLVVEESPTRLRVVALSEAQRRIASVLAGAPEMPKAAEGRVAALAARLAGVVGVQSDVGAAGAETVPADARPWFHLRPHGAGLAVQLYVQPLGADGPAFRPGAGKPHLLAEIGGRRVQAQRNLEEEELAAGVAVAGCPTLAAVDEEAESWALDDPDVALQVLQELEARGDEVVLAWPEGRPIRVGPPVGPDRLRLRIGARGDWFEARGELAVGDDVLDIARLLELLDRSPGRFVPLGEGRFVALTEAFRKRLDDLRAFSERSGQGARFRPFAALALEGLTEEAGELRGDAAWTRHEARLRAAVEPVLPPTFQGELRDYQLEGFRWLWRLAEWGAGACLADDMGLGKTVQALALVLARAHLGPTLVVAPTSVLRNWVREAGRFAPTLRVQTLGARDREATVKALGPFDVLVTSYGLLHQDADLLASVEWQVAVLDEAQAIKNPATRRSQAAMRLRAAFRLATTGTPVENHLGELWNLFRFLVPGLLGSRERFDERFALPIERDHDRAARQRLKRLVQPFLLRRTKADVLEELPSRTDVTLTVPLSPEEAALYEAQRRRALENLAGEAPSGGRSLQILAEITRLRRLCCDPRLVLPDAEVRGAKLDVLADLLDELLEGHHKALVFSQFVDLLTLVRAELDARGVRYQYLDGSTPGAERQRRVDAFQAGDGDVFLISLRAGGLGLNLTAADYVVHLDPWWNPAVEDQASDRAHRIGQQRPVTVYRLVAEHTIEEAIVALHHRKRDLAEGLLEGADAPGRLDPEELLRLIRE